MLRQSSRDAQENLKYGSEPLDVRNPRLKSEPVFVSNPIRASELIAQCKPTEEASLSRGKNLDP